MNPLRPAGIAGEIGEATVWHGIRSVEAQGRETASIGQPMTGFRFRALPAQGFAGEAFGEEPHLRPRPLGSFATSVIPIASANR